MVRRRVASRHTRTRGETFTQNQLLGAGSIETASA